MPDPIITNQRQLRSDPKETLDLLGTLLDEEAKRDAVHIAVLPVIAGQTLVPGEHIGLSGGKASPMSQWSNVQSQMPLGIVDPFLEEPVQPGQRFFLFLYPRKISSLRHVWSHPEIPDEVQGPTAQASNGGRPMPPLESERQASELWIRQFIANGDTPGYDVLIAAATNEPLPRNTYDDSSYGNDGEYLTFYNIDAHGDIPPEFWDHVEVVTGTTIPRERRAIRFSCAC